MPQEYSKSCQDQCKSILTEPEPKCKELHESMRLRYFEPNCETTTSRQITRMLNSRAKLPRARYILWRECDDIPSGSNAESPYQADGLRGSASSGKVARMLNAGAALRAPQLVLFDFLLQAQRTISIRTPFGKLQQTKTYCRPLPLTQPFLAVVLAPLSQSGLRYSDDVRVGDLCAGVQAGI